MRQEIAMFLLGFCIWVNGLVIGIIIAYRPRVEDTEERWPKV